MRLLAPFGKATCLSPPPQRENAKRPMTAPVPARRAGEYRHGCPVGGRRRPGHSRRAAVQFNRAWPLTSCHQYTKYSVDETLRGRGMAATYEYLRPALTVDAVVFGL